jgi:hypothetical protein
MCLTAYHFWKQEPRLSPSLTRKSLKPPLKLTSPAALVKFYSFKNGYALFQGVLQFLECVYTVGMAAQLRTDLLFHIFDRKLRKTFA